MVAGRKGGAKVLERYHFIEQSSTAQCCSTTWRGETDHARAVKTFTALLRTPLNKSWLPSSYVTGSRDVCRWLVCGGTLTLPLLTTKRCRGMLFLLWEMWRFRAGGGGQRNLKGSRGIKGALLAEVAVMIAQW
jgi:hypothetical protein